MSEQPELGRPFSTLDFVAIHQRFVESEPGQRLVGTPRWDDYRPDHIDRQEWIDQLGANFDDLEHHPYSYIVTQEFLKQCNEATAAHPDACFNEEEVQVLLLTSITNNWGDAHPEVGNIGIEKRTPQHTAREQEAWVEYFSSLLPEASPDLRDRVYETLFDHKVETKLGRARDAVQRMTYIHDIKWAWQAASTSEQVLSQHLQWLSGAGLKNQTGVLCEYAGIYPPVASFLKDNVELITEIYECLDTAQAFALSTEETHKVDNFLFAKRQWAESKYANMIEADRPSKIESILERNELFERLRRIIFRGVYDERGNPLQPYKDAEFELVTVLPPNIKSGLPTIRRGAKEEELYTPQPTIYANQTQIIETVSEFLAEEGYSIFDMPGSISYFWPGRGTFSITPPLLEQHNFKLDRGFIDLEDLLGQFDGAYLKDQAGNLHAMKDRFLDHYFVDEVTTKDHFDILNDEGRYPCYGRQSTGTWTFNIICDGAHRIDYAIEEQGRPITAILVTGSNGKPLVPYYALPLHFRPTMRSSSKQVEEAFGTPRIDKYHILHDFIRKVLHNDWSATGLNVSSLRGEGK